MYGAAKASIEHWKSGKRVGESLKLAMLYNVFMGTCKLCAKKHDRSYGAGIFCSEYCCRKHNGTSGGKIAQKKRTKSIRKYMSDMSDEDRRVWGEKRSISRSSNYVVRAGTTKIGKVPLNISIEDLVRYKESHQSCEICGAHRGIYIKGLAVDHQHGTDNFRGLLCMSCNTKLGWYENNQYAINNYLLRNISYNIAN